MALLHKMAICVVFCGFARKKVMATMSSPSSSGGVVEKVMVGGGFFLFYGAFGLVH
jgi:hypothetical protein